MPRPIVPRVPEEPVPLRADAVLDIQARAVFWARLSVLASVLVAVATILLTWRAVIHWGWAVVAGLLPLLPIAAQTRIEELRQKLLDQVRDAENERLRREAVQGQQQG